jgi:hypothetical protein
LSLPFGRTRLLSVKFFARDQTTAETVASLAPKRSTQMR